MLLSNFSVKIMPDVTTSRSGHFFSGRITISIVLVNSQPCSLHFQLTNLLSHLIKLPIIRVHVVEGALNARLKFYYHLIFS